MTNAWIRRVDSFLDQLPAILVREKNKTKMSVCGKKVVKNSYYILGINKEPI